MDTADKKTTTPHVVDVSKIPCPHCGRSDRWDGVVSVDSPDHNAELLVMCDCGLGELKIVVE